MEKLGKGKDILFTSVAVILGTYFLFLGLSKATGFLAPLTTAAILSLLMLPLARKMEKGVLNRPVASLLNTFIIFLVSLGFLAVISFQIKSFVDDWDNIKETMTPKVEQLKGFIFEHTPLSEEDLPESKGSGVFSGFTSGSNSGQKAASFLNSTLGFFGDYLLTFIYIFFLLNYRQRFKNFLLMLFPTEKKAEVKEVITKSAKVTQQYLVGKLLLIGLLAILYAIGLGITGVNNFILISIIASFLSLIPYIGNIVGFGLAMVFGYLTSGETGMLIGIVLTFSVAQFVESYILEPYVVGDKVELHPFFVILAVILGGMVWGVMGMILSIPILGILNVLFKHINPLKPYGYLLGNED